MLNSQKATASTEAVAFCGGLEGIRTLDPHNANVVRSQLRYKPLFLCSKLYPLQKHLSSIGKYIIAGMV